MRRGEGAEVGDEDAAALVAVKALKLDPADADLPKIETMKVENVIAAAVKTKGFLRVRNQHRQKQLGQPVLQMVSSDFVGRKEDSATLRREGDGSFSRFLCCSSVANPDVGGIEASREQLLEGFRQ